MTTRPVLGITACSRAFGEESAQVVIDRYMVAAMRHADAAALLIPARPDLMSAQEAAARLDGLLLTGSPSNLDPALSGVEEGYGPFDPGRDAMSMALIDAMTSLGKPVFGICRGFQELNVALGGTLDSRLADPGRALPHHSPDGVSLDAMFAHSHDVALTSGGILAGAFGRETLRVNSVHFQGVARLGDGLAIEATAPDGVIEAFSATVNGAPVLGVQWHPEWQADSDASSRGFFSLLGRALRGEKLAASKEKQE